MYNNKVYKMCRMYILWGSYNKDKKYNEIIDNHYSKYFDKKILSRGLCRIYNKSITYKKELHYNKDNKKQKIKEKLDNPKLKYLINHIRIPFDKKEESIIKNNIHPFVYKNRYLCMHNGQIEFKKNMSINEKKEIKGTTDSERFFNILIKIKEEKDLENIYEGILEIYKYILQDSLLNIIILDKVENIVIAYRGVAKHKEMTPLYIYNYGITNIRSDDDYIILPHNALFIRKNKENIIYKNYVKNL